MSDMVLFGGKIMGQI